MRRTLKAWTLLSLDGEIADVGLIRRSRSSMRRCKVIEERVVPCVVTYDDGRPAPRKRTKGGR